MWNSTCDLLAAVDGKVSLAKLSSFQPTHAEETVRAFRKTDGKADTWTDEVKDRIADWVDRCEKEEMTVEQLRVGQAPHKTRSSPG
jgi:hypothetical protein